MRRFTGTWRRWALAVVAGIGAAMLGAAGLATPLDDALYAGYARNWRLKPDGKTVLIAIDDRSLQELGQWPWPRSSHARLVDRLAAAGASGVALDVLMPEPDRAPGNDEALARAMRASGRVVLPVNAGNASAGGPPEELVPTASLAAAVRAMGHTDLEHGSGRATSLHLRAGVGSPRWPALPVALLEVERDRVAMPPKRVVAASRAWERADRVLLRFSGPAGTYPQYSYADVLHGRIADDAFRGRRVIVGATAAGLGHAIATPMPGTWMSTLEYMANATETLAQRAELRALDRGPGALLGFLLATLLAALLLRPALRTRLLASVLAIAGTLVASIAAASATHVWWGPSATVVTLAMLAAGTIAWDLQRVADRAELDGVTGLLSRRRFLRRLRRAAAHAAVAGEQLDVVSVEIAGMRQYRARMGELAAAVLLARVAHLASTELDGARDFAGRTSDASLAGVLVGRPDDDAGAMVDRLRDRAGRAVQEDRAASGVADLAVRVGSARASERAAEPWPMLLRRAAGSAREAHHRPA